MNELGIQRELCKQANSEGAHAYKCSNRFLIGVPDISVQYPGLHKTLIEVKYERGFNMGGFVTVELTPHQRHFLERDQAAGGKSGWVMVVAITRGEYWIYCDVKLVDSARLHRNVGYPLGGLMLCRLRGESWPIRQIVEAMQ